MRNTMISLILFATACAPSFNDGSLQSDLELKNELAAKTAQITQLQLLIEDHETNMSTVAQLLRCVEKRETGGKISLEVVCPPDGI